MISDKSLSTIIYISLCPKSDLSEIISRDKSDLSEIKELMLLNCGVGEDSWESLGLWGNQTSQSWRKSILNIHWKHWCWGWSFNTLATWCEELIDWKRPWCWERLKTGGKGDEMVGWHHQLDGHEFEQPPGVGEGQGNLVSCSPWGHKESDTTEQLNRTEVYENFQVTWVLGTCFPNLKSIYTLSGNNLLDNAPGVTRACSCGSSLASPLL